VVTAGAVIGYQILLPPGWAQIPLRAGTDEAVAAILDAATEGHTPPPDWREQMTVELGKTATRARADSCVHLYVPIAALHGLTVPAAISVADVAFGSLDPLDPSLLVQRLAAAPGGKQVIIAGAVCSRAESTHPADPNHGAPLPFRRVDYLMPFPDDPDRWLVVTFTTLAPENLEWVALFDAMMTTFAWTQQP
jgi:hypothetical protein